MQTIRIFISSPGDVAEERQIAGKVLERLQGKYWSFVRLDDVFWEYKAVRATAHYQDELINPGECEMVIGILWSRLGSPLPAKFAKYTGEVPTGTEWELEQAFEAYAKALEISHDPKEAKPDILIYRKMPVPSGLTGDAALQLEKLETYFREKYFHPDGTIRRPILSYNQLAEFEYKFTLHVEELILRTIPKLQPGYEPPPISGSPFKGLEAFEFKDADRFFGRNRQIREVQQRLRERAQSGSAFVVIYGASGYGKSSLMKAGLAPTICRPGGALDGMDCWRRVLLQPSQGTGPLCERLARALMSSPTAGEIELAKVVANYPSQGIPELRHTRLPVGQGTWDEAILARSLADVEQYAMTVAAVAATLAEKEVHLLLMVDQLEEVFNEGVTQDEREAFFRALHGFALCRRVWVVATMRSEYFARIAAEPELRRLVGKEGGYILPPPDLQSLSEIIRFPVLAARLGYERATEPRKIAGELTREEWLHDQILADTRENTDALPLLEFCLERLYERRRDNLLTWDAYEAMGGLPGSIATTATEVYGQLDAAAKGARDLIFGNLVRVGETVTRRRADLRELESRPGAAAFLRAFREAKLLVTDEEAGTPTVTLAHESLLTHWPLLAQWIDLHRADLAAHHRLVEQAALWEQNGRSKKYLLSEGRLAEAQRVAGSAFLLLNDSQRSLLDLSRSAARRRLRILQGAVVVFALLAAGAGALGWIAEKRKTEVEKKSAEVIEANNDNKANLHKASMADYAVAVQRIEKDGKWHEGVALLARSLEREPKNPLAAARLYSTLAFYAAEKKSWPRDIIRHEARVYSAQFSPDGTRIVTASDDKTARLWDAATSQPVGNPLRHEAVVWSAQFSPDGTRIVTASDNTAQLWDAATGQPIGEPLRHENMVKSTQFSPDGTRIVTASDDKTARLWDAATAQPIGELLRHENMVWSAQFNPDGTRIVTASADNTARLWDAATGQPIGKPLRHEDVVWSAQFSPDGTRIVTASDDNTSRLWDAVTGQPIGEPLRHEARVYSAQFSPDGTRIVTASGNTVRLWDAATGLPIGEPLRHEAWAGVNSAEFSPDGTRIVTASFDKTARLWDAATGQPIGEPLRHENMVNSAQFSPDGTRIVTASEDKAARLWDAATSQPVGNPLRHENMVVSAQFSPDGTRIVTASADNTARLWDAATAQPIGKPLRHEAGVNSAQFSPDGTRIVTASDNTARLWDAATGQPIGEPLRHENMVNSAQFSADGTRIVTASDDNIARLWDAATGQPIGEPLRHEYRLNSAEFSADGTRIVTASDDNTARLWDAATGQPIGGPLRHENMVNSAQFSADGTRIVTASADNTARLWDAATGQPIGEPLRHEAGVNSAQFSPDGTRIVTASVDSTARVWEIFYSLYPSTPVIEWMLFKAQAIASWDFDSYGQMKAIPDDRRRDLLLAPPTGDDAWARLARWLALPCHERTLTPDSKFTCRQIAERERDSGYSEGLESALRYDPTIPLARILQAGFMEREIDRSEKPDSSLTPRVAFLRRYDLDLMAKQRGVMPAKDLAVLYASAAKSLNEAPKDAKVGIGPKATGIRDEALKAAELALELDPALTEALRQKAKALERLQRVSEAVAAYEKLHTLPDAVVEDFTDAAYLLAKENDSEKCRAILARGTQRFSAAEKFHRLSGWCHLNLNDPVSALTSFLAARSALKAEQKPGTDLLAGLALAQWLNNLRDAAITTYKELIETGRAADKPTDWATPETIQKLDWPEAETKPLQALRAATLEKHPELIPQNPAEHEEP